MKNIVVTVNDRVCSPNFAEDISFTTKRASDERYYRTELNDDLTFDDQNGDYSYIKGKVFDTEFKVLITYGDWSWRGVFYKTDCTFNEDKRTVKVKPDVDDNYKRLLEVISDKVDVIAESPRPTNITLTQRPIFQIFVAFGSVPDSILTNNVGNMIWEQDVNVDDSKTEDELREWLTDTCHFYEYEADEFYVVEATTYEEVAGYYVLTEYEEPKKRSLMYKYTYTRRDNTCKFVVIERIDTDDSGEDIYVTDTTFYDESGAVIVTDSVSNYTDWPSPSVADMTLNKSRYRYYMRMLLAEKFLDSDYDVNADDDIIDLNLNYLYVRPLQIETTHGPVIFSSEVSTTKTKYGQDKDGNYFVKPDYAVYPIAKSTWQPLSVWLINLNELLESGARKEYTLKDAYSLPEVLSTMIAKLVPDANNGIAITHKDEAVYSSTLYEKTKGIFLSPISNVKKTYYENPAQKGELTLRSLLDMLKKCFNCYWFIDEQGCFRIESEDWFRNGNAFTGSQRTLIDTTEVLAARNFKAWSFGQNEWTYDKVELPEKISFAWQEKQTDPFEGTTLEYKSNYVQKGETEDVTISDFEADVDYIVEMKDSVSDDGWVLLIPEKQDDSSWKVPISSVVCEGASMLVQNPLATRVSLMETYGRYDMSCPTYVFNGTTGTALTTKRVKQQKLTCPKPDVMDPYGLVTTGVGTGEVESMDYTPLHDSVELDLIFDTES